MPQEISLSPPAYHRRIHIEAREGVVAAMLEDDIHCLAVILRHDGACVLSVEPQHERLPWTTCPGAQAKLVETFAGVALSEVTARRDKKQNCTHFHDMAVLAASHAGDRGTVIYDIVATDPVAGERVLEIRREGVLQHRWIEQGGVIRSPDAIAGQSLFTLRDWIGTLAGEAQTCARLLQWGAMVAHGRTMPLEEQETASSMPPNCWSFQPERARVAVRNGERRDFSQGAAAPLDGFSDRVRAAL